LQWYALRLSLLASSETVAFRCILPLSRSHSLFHIFTFTATFTATFSTLSLTPHTSFHIAPHVTHASVTVTGNSVTCVLLLPRCVFGFREPRDLNPLNCHEALTSPPCQLPLSLTHLPRPPNPPTHVSFSSTFPSVLPPPSPKDHLLHSADCTQ
jgi:hypothetical protein